LRVLFQRRTPDSEAIFFKSPKTEEDWEQQLQILKPLPEKDQMKEAQRKQNSQE